MGQSGYVHLEDCTIVAETEKAILVKYEGDDYWFPRSQIADADDLTVGEDGVTVSVTEWIALKNGIEG